MESMIMSKHWMHCHRKHQNVKMNKEKIKKSLKKQTVLAEDVMLSEGDERKTEKNWKKYLNYWTKSKKIRETAEMMKKRKHIVRKNWTKKLVKQ